MKVFLSWSGESSRRLAEALREWLPSVLQAVEPWMSAEDVEKGARWSSEVAGELSGARVGILCLTRDNLAAPWLLFEAGALSKTLERTAVCPYLLGLRPSDLRGPLVQFQAAEANREDTRRLLATINAALGKNALSERSLDRAFATWWPQLEKALATLPPSRPHAARTTSARSERDLLEEVLTLVRDLARERADSPAAPSREIQRAFLQGLSEGLQGRLDRDDGLVALADRVEVEREQRERKGRARPRRSDGRKRASSTSPALG
jgi:TIR domain